MDTPHDAATITIDRKYFDTMMRRARFNSDEAENARNPTLVISKSEYDGLLAVARQYAALRQNLLAGGVTEDTLAFLSREHGPASSEPCPVTTAPTHTVQQPATPYDTAQRHRRSANASQGHGFGVSVNPSLGQAAVQHPKQNPGGRGDGRRDWADAPLSPDDDSLSENGPANPQSVQVGDVGGELPRSREQYDRVADRTLLLSNLADGVMHGDITAVVRGGLLLDLYLRFHDRTASISFLQAADAKSFYEHVRRHDLYIKNKRVDVRWHDRQFVLPGHVANKISTGATRNLVIRRCDAKHTEQSIRDDLEHIHNLVVIKVVFVSGNCHISTNSVHNAMFARTCMISRQRYKGSKIEWDLDECTLPLEKVPSRWVSREKAAPKRPLNPMANRFQLLNLDNEDNNDEPEMNKAFAAQNSVDIAA